MHVGRGAYGAHGAGSDGGRDGGRGGRRRNDVAVVAPSAADRYVVVTTVLGQAIALAGRADCPIYVADAVVAEAGITHEEAVERGLPVGDEPPEA